MISKERRHALRITQGPRSRASIAACHSSFQTPHSSFGATYNFQMCDSVPDLSSNGGGFNESPNISMLTNHALLTSSAPRKIPPMNNSTSKSDSKNHNNNNSNNNCLMNGYGTPVRNQKHNTKNTTPGTTVDYDNDDTVVQLRRRNAHISQITYENDTNEKHNDWMYRRPTAPNDIRHSCEYFQ